ncbi:hypothetical protein SCORR_v1c07220 [Spiroplasma corruscae]|uniref:Asp23/Gls24 family envelope stress response protein n=1 Tax=Spiroplasma corruscae TaxID=216934 RepID=A0A222EQI9_9MOLU|nr:hypothetical protein [Spiroplasma corruscae]ASP28494.1 hypothetical protein SCORR_v1c07220 [Spiroplasma corruscae]
MYITLEKNSSGEIQVEDQIITKIIDKDIKSNIDSSLNLEVVVLWEQENSMFINIKIKVENRETVSIDERKIIHSINELIKQTIGVKPKTISVSFI